MRAKTFTFALKWWNKYLTGRASPQYQKNFLFNLKKRLNELDSHDELKLDTDYIPCNNLEDLMKISELNTPEESIINRYEGYLAFSLPYKWSFVVDPPTSVKL